MGRLAFDENNPAHITWPVTRGTTNADGESLPLYFAEPGGYTITELGDGAQSVTVTDPIDLTGRVFTGKVSDGKGGTELASLTLLDPDPTDGEADLVLSRTELLKLSTGRYVFDLVSDRGDSDETTIIIGTLIVSGRAST